MAVAAATERTAPQQLVGSDEIWASATSPSGRFTGSNFWDGGPGSARSNADGQRSSPNGCRTAGVLKLARSRESSTPASYHALCPRLFQSSMGRPGARREPAPPLTRSLVGQPGPPLAALAKAGWVAQGVGGEAISDPGDIRGNAVTSGELQVEDATKTSVHLVQERQRGVAHVVGEVDLVQGDEGGHVDDRIPE
jgi:hypothetical protein